MMFCSKYRMWLRKLPWIRYGLIILIVGTVIVFGGDVFAQQFDAGGLIGERIFTDQGSINIDRIKSADAILKTLYLIMWPLMALAGAAMDNTLVYGQGFYLDVTLFKFWQLIRTFTMFAVGFIFIGTILYAFFNPESAQQKIKDVVIKSLIASVVVNMSRWIVAALIDISTILVTTIGALPLFIMGETEIIKDIRFVQVHSYYDRVDTTETDANENTYSTVYSCPADGTPVFFLPCTFDRREDNGGVQKTGLIEKEDGTIPNTMESLKTKTLEFWGPQADKIGMTDNINLEYCHFEGGLIKHEPEAHYNECETWEDLKQQGRDAMALTGGFNCMPFDEMTSLAANTSGPLYTLYGSIFALSNLPATTNYGNTGEVAIEMLMKIIVGLALVIPLLAFSVVMIIRVVVLRLVIAFSPLLAMAYVYDFKKITEVSEGKFTFQNILNLLMMPVLGVFALSISIVFLTLLNNVDYIEKKNGEPPSEKGDVCQKSLPTAFMPNSIEEIDSGDQNSKCYKMLGIQTICLSEGERVSLGNIANTLTWLITNMLGIALMWMAVMFVLKTNEFTKGTVDFIDSTAKSIAKSAKIVPVPGRIGAVSVGGAQQALSQLQRSIPQKMIQSAYENNGMESMVNKTVARIDGVDKRVADTARQGAENGDASFVSGPKETNAERFGFRDWESKGIPQYMGAAIAKEMQADKEKYGEISADQVKALQGVTTFKELLSNPNFVRHATINNYFDDFARNRGGTDLTDRRMASNQLVEGLTAQAKESGGLISQETAAVGGLKTMWYIHNGQITRIKSSVRDGTIDFENEGVQTYNFPVYSPENPGASVFENKEAIDDFMKVFKNEFGYSLATYEKVWGENGPFIEAIRQISNAQPPQGNTQVEVPIQTSGEGEIVVVREVTSATDNNGAVTYTTSNITVRSPGGSSNEASTE